MVSLTATLWGLANISIGRRAANFVPSMTEAAKAKKKTARASRSAGSAADNASQSANNASPQQGSTGATGIATFDQRFDLAEERMIARVEAHFDDRFDDRFDAHIEERIIARVEAGVEARLAARLAARVDARLGSMNNFIAGLNQYNQGQVLHHSYEADPNQGAYNEFTYPDPPAPQ
jgi:hypothetical protein